MVRPHAPGPAAGLALVLLALGAGCGGGGGSGGDGGSPDGGPGPGPDGGTGPQPDAGPPRPDGPPPLGEVSGAIRVDHMGWRAGDPKVAVLLGAGGATVEVRSAADNSVEATFTAGGVETDEDSQDSVALLDFSSLVAPGDYYLYVPSLGARSYGFRIADDVYRVVGAAAVKSYFFQRCNHDRVLPSASDALPGHPGLGAEWPDGACHGTDWSAPAGPGSADHGPLDVHGGWHDAGDYQKTLWGRGVPQMLFAYEVNPAAWTDGQLAIPESGNGVPDLLDEARWELDFYLRLQRPDGHFMSSVKGRAPASGAVMSPPSASNEGRVYFDGTSPSGDGWSGGGVTVSAATGNAVLSLAHAAIVFRGLGEDGIADDYASAARAGWAWLDGRSLSGDERRIKAAAAAAVARMDPSVTSARTFADGFAWATWDGLLPYSVTPAESVIAAGAWHYLLDPSSTASVKTTIRGAAAEAIVVRAFSEAGVYGGMFGGPDDGWDWGWGSNRQQATYGANLLMANHLGVTGSHSADEVIAQAQKHLHFLLGLNPLNMLYLTNMAAYGGEHSSFQLYHGWFSHTGGDGDHGNAEWNGKPVGVDEPLYPYHPEDTQTSTMGPAPGLVPGGPNAYYSCAYDIPDRDRPAYAYRDFSVGCDWDNDLYACLACSWEITEPMAAYQGPFVLLVSFFM